MMTHFKSLSACTASVAAIVAVATLPRLAGSPAPWYVLLVGYGLLAVWATIVLRHEGRAAELLRLRSGDLTLGIVCGLALAGAGFFVLRFLAPLSSPRAAWLFGLYAQFGDVQGEALRATALLVVVVFEEVVWRGLVQGHATAAWGPLRGVLVTAVLYCVAHTPTLFTLRVPELGPNPLLLMAALGFGTLWGILALLTQRIAPAIVCHAVVSYFMAAPAPAWLW